MKKIIGQYEGEIMRSRGDTFYTLARSIAGQQISVKAADAIWKRLEAYGEVTPRTYLDAAEDDLRALGLSRSKVAYLKNIAEYFHLNDTSHLPALDDEALITELTKLKGVGRWTAEMLLIFHYQRPDVLPLLDIGLLKSIYRHYNDSEEMDVKAVQQLAEKWKPYRSVATWYLWRALDPVPVEY